MKYVHGYNISSMPGSTLWDLEWETAEQIGGVHFSTNNSVDKAFIMLESSLLQTADLEMM